MDRNADGFKEFLEVVSTNQSNVIDVAKQILDGKEQMQVVLKREEVTPLQPVREISPPRAHLFYSIKSLTEYLDNFGYLDNSIIYAKRNNKILEMKVVLNESSTNGYEILCCVPNRNPTFNKFLQLVGTKLSLNGFIHALYAMERAVIKPDQKELMLLFAQVKMANNTQVSTEQGINRKTSLMVDVQYSGKTKGEKAEIPQVLEFTMPVYLEDSVKTYTFRTLVDMYSEGSNILISLEHINFEEVFLDATNELLKTLVRYHVLDGQPMYQEWRFVGESSLSDE